MNSHRTPSVEASASPDRTFASGFLVIALFGALAGAARIAQDAALAWRHGSGPLVDAYYFAFSVASWPGAVISAVLMTLVAPKEAALRRGDDGELSTRRLRAGLMACALLAAVSAWPLALWLLPDIAFGSFAGLQPAVEKFARAGMPALAVVLALGLPAALLAAWLVAAGQRLLMLLEALPPLVLVAALLWMPDTTLFWGAAGGVALHVLAMAALLHFMQALPAPRFGDSLPALRALGAGAMAMLAGQMVFALIPLIDPWFALQLGHGEVARLSFASRLVLGLQGLLGLALQRAGLPALAQASVDAPATARRMAWRWALMAGAVGSFVALLVAAMADPLVALLYERGEFRAQDRERVAELVRWGTLQMPPFLAGLVLVTALSAAGRTGWLAGITAASFVIKLLLSAGLSVPLGTTGLLLATALMYVATVLFAVLALRRAAKPVAARSAPVTT